MKCPYCRKESETWRCSHCLAQIPKPEIPKPEKPKPEKAETREKTRETKEKE